MSIKPAECSTAWCAAASKQVYLFRNNSWCRSLWSIVIDSNRPGHLRRIKVKVPHFSRLISRSVNCHFDQAFQAFLMMRWAPYSCLFLFTRDSRELLCNRILHKNRHYVMWALLVESKQHSQYKPNRGVGVLFSTVELL